MNFNMEFSYYNEIRMVELGFPFSVLENIKYKVSI